MTTRVYPIKHGFYIHVDVSQVHKVSILPGHDSQHLLIRFDQQNVYISYIKRKRTYASPLQIKKGTGEHKASPRKTSSKQNDKEAIFQFKKKIETHVSIYYKNRSLIFHVQFLFVLFHFSLF